MTALSLHSMERFSAVLFCLFLIPCFAHAEEPGCTACHQELTTGTSIHAAISMGCPSCHSAVDASDVPHTISNKNPKGLSSKVRDLCFGCHDKQSFTKKIVHGAMTLGCTSCHNPHVSGNAHLLKDAVPQLCLSLNCHGERLMAKKSAAHSAAGNQACVKCHNPHASDSPKLLVPSGHAGSVSRQP